MTGNTLTGTDWFGSINNDPVIFKTNSQIRMRINANGDIIFKSFDAIGSTGLFMYDANGKLVGIPFTGINDVLRGDGTFGTLTSAAGWFHLRLIK